MIEAWRRAREEVVSGVMIGWSVIAWLSMIALDMPWNWLKLIGPMDLGSAAAGAGKSQPDCATFPRLRRCHGAGRGRPVRGLIDFSAR